MKNHSSYLLIFLLTVCIGCTKQSTQTDVITKVQNDSSLIESEALHKLSEDASLLFATCIPDHAKMTTLARPHFTRDFLNAWDDITHLPCVETYASDGVPEYEWLWYFVSGNGGCEEIYAHILQRIITNDSIAEIQVAYTCNKEWTSESNSAVHTISLVWQNDQWLIDDYDNTKQEMISRVEKDVADYQSYINYFKTYDADDFFEENVIIDYRNFERYKSDMQIFINCRNEGRNYFDFLTLN